MSRAKRAEASICFKRNTLLILQFNRTTMTQQPSSTLPHPKLKWQKKRTNKKARPPAYTECCYQLQS